MTIKSFLIILIILIIGIVLLKALRALLSIILTILLLYFCYYTFLTYPGAVKLSVFRSTLDFSSYKIKTEDYNKPIKYILNPPLELKDISITEIECNEYGPIKICDASSEEK